MPKYAKLIGRIAECGYNQSTFSKEIAMSRPTLRRKLRGDVGFNSDDIERICHALYIKKDEIGAYFF